MAGELSPAGDRPGDEARPELRASYADRDRVVEVLRVAAGDGRLTAAELDERVEAALTARTYRDLERLTADLPTVPGSWVAPGQEAKDVVRLDRRGTNARRDGAWPVPRRMEVRVSGCTVTLDFTEAVITQPTLEIEAEVRGANFILITRPGIEVDTDDMAMIGGTVRVRPHAGPKVPTILKITVSGANKGGRVVARPPRRTFGQWLRRAPRDVRPAGTGRG